jgi:hypothetical protein
MKKTLLAVAALASVGFSAASMAAPMPVGTGSFQWAGTVPAATVSGAGYWIVKDGALDLDSGLLTFTNTGGAGAVALQSSSEIGFKVVKDVTAADNVAPNGTYDAGIDVTPLAYTAVLSNVKVGVNGLASEQAADGYFAVHADGSAVATAIGADIAKMTGDAKGKPTRLTLKAKANTVSPLEAGDDVAVIVTMAITPDNA